MDSGTSTNIACDVDGNGQCIVDDANLLDFTQIINSADLNFSETELSKISPRFSAKKTKKVPAVSTPNVEYHGFLDR